MAAKLKLYMVTIPVPKKPEPFIGAEWGPSAKIALKHCLRKAFKCRGIRSFWIDDKEFDTPSTTYAYIVRTKKIDFFTKESPNL
jgi:hypothetical protein